ncbi:MAG: hypothetical protein KGS72_18090 [Cyanobacteria bacterium REEB67]|nr:hypothetical protein [Cyanobacteria bacterium REEB67]
MAGQQSRPLTYFYRALLAACCALLLPNAPILAKDAALHTPGAVSRGALNLYLEGEHYEKNKEYAKAVESFRQALREMAHEKHDPKFHLKVETALSRVKAKAGIRQ